MKARWFCLSGLAAAGALTVALPAPADPLAPKNESVMRQKLGWSQKALEAVSIADYDVLERAGNELVALSKRAEWQAFKTAEYTRQLEEFRSNARSLAKAGKEKNNDAAALAYVQLSMNCFNCHRHVRDQRMALAK